MTEPGDGKKWAFSQFDLCEARFIFVMAMQYFNLVLILLLRQRTGPLILFPERMRE